MGTETHDRRRTLREAPAAKLLSCRQTAAGGQAAPADSTPRGGAPLSGVIAVTTVRREMTTARREILKTGNAWFASAGMKPSQLLPAAKGMEQD